MDSQLLDITQGAQFDDSITKLEIHTHLPYASSKYGPSDEIRIPFQQSDTYVWPAGSSLIVEGSITGFKEFTLAANAGAHAFSQIRIYINNQEADSITNPGITSTLKGLASFSKANAERLNSAGWKMSEVNPVVQSENGYFNMCIPMNTLLGFLEDYTKILMNVRMELVLVRANRDENMFTPLVAETKETPVLNITKIAWKIPYVFLNDREKLRMLKILDQNLPLEIPFRSWSLHTYPTLPQTTSHSWTIKTSNQLEKPRFVVFALQTGRNANLKMDASAFDHCNLKEIKLFVASNAFPYDNLNLDFKKKSLSWLYEMYANFQSAYYGKESNMPMLNYEEFIQKAPLVVIDCSHQTEPTINSTMDIRLEFEFQENVPPNTSAFCLIIHDQLLTYYPLTGIISKGI